jgi:hypothetical protein
MECWWFKSIQAEIGMILNMSSIMVNAFDCKSKDEGSNPFSGLNLYLFKNGYDGMVDMLDSKFSAFISLRVQVPLSARVQYSTA